MNKKYKWICDYCGIEYNITSSQYHRLKDGRQRKGYCSTGCKNNSQHKKVMVHCAYCGASMERTEYQAHKNKNAFCSKECKAKFLYELTRETRRCEICEQEYITKKISSQKFCSHKCADIYQKTRVGELNSHYNQKEITCDWCDKFFTIPMYRVKQNQHFCSTKCRQEWFANDFSQREDFRNNLRTQLLQRMSERVMPNLDSKPQLIINEILDELNINYIREYPLDFYAIDNYLNDTGLMIEVQGDYFHANPLRYSNKSELNQTQLNRLGRDRAKHSFIKNKYSVEVLYIWETDIYNYKDMCKELIKTYIFNNGILPNYNSFNYYLSDNILTLKESIVISFQEQDNITYSKIRNDCDGLCGNILT